MCSVFILWVVYLFVLFLSFLLFFLSASKICIWWKKICRKRGSNIYIEINAQTRLHRKISPRKIMQHIKQMNALNFIRVRCVVQQICIYLKWKRQTAKWTHMHIVRHIEIIQIKEVKTQKYLFAALCRTKSFNKQNKKRIIEIKLEFFGMGIERKKVKKWWLIWISIVLSILFKLYPPQNPKLLFKCEREGEIKAEFLFLPKIFHVY